MAVRVSALPIQISKSPSLLVKAKVVVSLTEISFVVVPEQPLLSFAVTVTVFVPMVLHCAFTVEVLSVPMAEPSVPRFQVYVS